MHVSLPLNLATTTNTNNNNNFLCSVNVKTNQILVGFFPALLHLLHPSSVREKQGNKDKLQRIKIPPLFMRTT